LAEENSVAQPKFTERKRRLLIKGEKGEKKDE
jgi:hypothetical protein